MPESPAEVASADWVYADWVWAEDVMGTVASFHIFGMGPPPSDRPSRSNDQAGEDAMVREAVAAACRLLHRADETFSIWRPQSPASLYRAGRSTLVDMPPDFGEVLELCLEARRITNGWFDPWAAPGGFDPTGLVKGWAAGRATEVLAQRGISVALLNAGGDIATISSPPGGWRVGIRHPWRPRSLACVLDVASPAMATSGRYERGDHLFSTRPAAPVTSATVTGPSLAFCDAYATALAVGGDEVFSIIAALPGYDAYMIGNDGSEQSTAGVSFAVA